MSLKVKVNECKDLPNIEKIGLIDPYVVLTFRGIEKKTSVIDDNVNPIWEGEEFEWTLQSSLNPSEILKIEVYDDQTVGRNRLVGTVDYSVSQLWGQKNKDETLRLTPSKQAAKVKGAESATISLSFIFTSLSDQVGQARKTAHQVRGGGGVEEGEEDGGYIDEESEQGVGGDYVEGGIESGAFGGGNGNGVVGARRKKTVKHPKLPDKPTDFQIRIHIIEGRKLEGNNICPLVKVSCGDETQKTSSRRGTNSPVFDETLIFNFKERPVELFEKNIEIKVLDTSGKIKNSIIGVFSLDIGTVYYEPRHTFFHKWVLLTHQDDPSLGARGFIKATLSVLGPEDDPIHSVPDTSVDDVDIESNLLRPSGVRLEAATLSVMLYSAEDLPQMDPGYFEKFKSILNLSTGKKELVDPYCTVSFAGHKISTDVKWNTQNPQWNEQVNVGFRFPSICERLRFELKDKDKLNADDFIGTCIIRLNEITAPGDNGFLPTFGPCHVNVYGSPREFTDLPDQYDHLNKGLFEGVAYRGRVLVEISTTVGNSPNEKREMISPAEQRKLQLFQKRHRYVLSAVFMSASMIQCGKGEVQFEVSVGNYGYSVDRSTVAQSSTTHPTHPVYDGRNYSYMPWYSSKPLVLLESYWEDCRYRIESLNLLANTTNMLNKGLESVKRLLHLPEKYQQLVPERIADLCEELLNGIMSLRLTLPKLPDVFNKLDKHLRKYREEEISALCPIVDTLTAEVAGKLSSSQPMSSEDISKYIEELQYVLDQLKSLCVEPQNCVPDVIIWMLVDGKRVASKRIPSHLLMYSNDPERRGEQCGKIQTIQLNPPAVVKDKHRDGNKDSCLLQLMLWMGYDSDRTACYDDPHGPGGEISTYAETYENEAFYGIWGTGRKLACYPWSDASGKVKLNKEYFEQPAGWSWEGDWFIDPEDDELAKSEELTVTVDIYEIQSREPYNPWPKADESVYADTSGLGFMNFDKDGEEKPMSKEDIDKEIPSGWKWASPWVYITDGPVSSDGWEHTVSRYDPIEGLSADTEYVAIERNDHITRRRRWVRTREKQPDTNEGRVEREAPKDKGWMYARHPNSAFHSGKQKLDFFRRRRWHRSLSCEEVGRPAVFYILRKKDKKKREERARRLTESETEGIAVDSTGLGYQITPKTYLTFKHDEYTCYQLRAYLYQARDLYAADNTGLSDPYIVLSCGNVSRRSKILTETLSPKWNETLVLNNIRLYGNPKSVQYTPPTVALEIYDKDFVGHNEYMGMVMVSPLVRITPDTEGPVLEWFPVTRYGKPAGELLAAFELIRIGSQGWEPPQLEKDSDGSSYLIPAHIEPETQKMRIEVLCWGVRDMKRFLLLPISHPLVEVEVGGEAKDTAYIRDLSTNPMFPRPILIFDADLPVENVYSPPLNIRVFDQRKFGYSPLVGNCTITTLKDYQEEIAIKKPRSLHSRSKGSILGTAKEDVVIDLENMVSDTVGMLDSSDQDDYRFDWWSKYYSSIGETSRVQSGYLDENHDKMKEYEKELETYFDGFSDLCQTFPLHRGKGQQQSAGDDGSAVGFFKGAIKVYKRTSEATKFSSQLPIKWPQEVTVRVYIIRGFDLSPKDIGGSSDPYIKIAVGKTEKSDKDNFIANQLNPIFGKTFEVDALLPFDRTLTITVMDHDYLSADDIIGSTTIDLENRFLSLHRPICGLSETFSKSGCNRWRDVMSPIDILNAYCTLKELGSPKWVGNNSVTVGDTTYTLDQFERGVTLHPNVGDEKSRLALHVLRSCDAEFVPEHIEKRTLYSAVQPGVPQGHLHMWVDIFPKLPNVIIPPKVDITPRKAEKYVLRIVVWNTSDVILDERSAVTGDDMSDIYVKGWLSGSDDIQKTDVHYRSMDGDGMFNWRLVFPFEYIKPEQKMIVSVKEHFYSLSKTERRLPVRFNLQVWDNDLLNPDDFLGNLEFDLHNMPRPAKSRRRCRLRMLEEDDRQNKFIDLFEQKHIKGWLPVFQENYPAERGRDQRGNRTLTGKVEVEMEILTEEEEKARPAGKARDEPNQNPVLEKPDRPELSFAWYASPLKSFKFLVWRHHKKKIIFGIIFLIIFLSVLMLF